MPAARRLTVGHGREPAELLPDLPAPLSSGPWALAEVLGQALRYTGTELGAAELLAVSGAAFAVPWTCPLVGGPEPLPRRLVAALQRLGYAQSAVGLPAPEEAAAAVAAEAAAGRPSLALGWTPEPAGWVLLAGCDPQGRLCGRLARGQAGEPYVAAPGPVELLLLLGPPGEAEAPLLELIAVAARHAWREAAPSAAEGWAALLHVLAGEPPQPSRTAAVLRRALRELAAAREAAAAVLERLAEAAPETPAAWLVRGQDRLLSVMEAGDALAETLLAAEAEVLLQQEDWRESVAATLERVAARDAAAADCLLRAVEADYPPEEEDYGERDAD